SRLQTLRWRRHSCRISLSFFFGTFLPLADLALLSVQDAARSTRGRPLCRNLRSRSTTSSSLKETTSLPVLENSPSTHVSQPSEANSASSALRFLGGTARTMRSCDSDS